MLDNPEDDRLRWRRVEEARLTLCPGGTPRPRWKGDEAPPAEARWSEPARRAAILLGIGLLTLHAFHRHVYVSLLSEGWNGSLHALSALLGALPYHWLFSVLPATALGVSCYTVLQLPIGRAARLAPLPGARVLRARVLTTLTAAICLYVFFSCVWFLPFFLGAEAGAVAPQVWALSSSDLEDGRALQGVIVPLLWIAGLGTGWVVMECGFQLRQMWRGMTFYRGLVVGILALAIAVPVANLYRFLGPPAPAVAMHPERWPPGMEDWVRGRATRRAGVSPGDFLVTHDREGKVVPYYEVRRQRRESRHDDGSTCDLCLLPVTSLFGVSVDLALAADPPLEARPDLILEVPASARVVRVFDLQGPEPQILSLEDFLLRPPRGAWFVLKADIGLDLAIVTAILRALRDDGARRVSLAMRSVGWAEPSGPLPELRLSPGNDALDWKPETRRRTIIFVSRWEPGGPPPPCREELDWPYEFEAQEGLVVPAPGSVSEVIAVSARSYQAGLSTLALAVAGGARLIYLSPPE